MSKLSPKEIQETASAHMDWKSKLSEVGHLISGDGQQEKDVVVTRKDRAVKDGPYCCLILNTASIGLNDMLSDSYLLVFIYICM